MQAGNTKDLAWMWISTLRTQAATALILPFLLMHSVVLVAVALVAVFQGARRVRSTSRCRMSGRE